MKETFEKGPWLVEYELDDGGRLCRLCYNNYDLLTTVPDDFKPPSKNYGEYETRPVYGYDDCFPSVEVSKYPGLNWTVPDHGELCWLHWESVIKSDRIIFSVASKVLPIRFKRTLKFQEKQLTWTFEVKNNGDQPLPFQHVIHPLIKLTKIKDLRFPDFASLNNEAKEALEITTPESLRDFLLSSSMGKAYMLYMQEPDDNFVQWTYNNGLQVRMTYPSNEFTSVGIWWNNCAYPDEDVCRRDECAFEPIPGSTSKLEEAYGEGRSLLVKAGETKSWDIVLALELN